MKICFPALLVALLLSCAAGVHYYKFEEPSSDDSLLLVGRIIVEDNQFTGRYDVIKSGIEVAVLGRPENSEITGLWTTTDENGYFAIANAPKGDYALKGIRLTLSNGRRITLSNPLLKDVNYFRFNSGENILMQGDYFAFKPIGRVLSFQHNLFRLNPKASMFSLEYDIQPRLDHYKLVDGSVVNDGPVEEYLLKKYPDTQWRDALLASSRASQKP